MKVYFNENAKIEFVNQFLKSDIDVDYDQINGNIEIGITKNDSEFWLKANIDFSDAVKMITDIKPDYCIGSESKDYDYANYAVSDLVEIIKMYQIEFIAKITEFEVCFR